MNTEKSNETTTSPAYRALAQLQIVGQTGFPEQDLAVRALAALLLRVRKIDASLERARALIVVLQSSRDGRIDLRVGKNRSLPGGRTYFFVRWTGDGPRQYARKVVAHNAFRYVRQGKGSTRPHYELARKLVRQAAALMDERQIFMRLAFSLRRVQSRIHKSTLVEKMVELITSSTPKALTMLAVYAAQSGEELANAAGDVPEWVTADREAISK
jgi:hypothetical protein